MCFRDECRAKEWACVRVMGDSVARVCCVRVLCESVARECCVSIV